MGKQILIYLASPYSHKDPKVREDRATKVALFAAQLLRKGMTVFCPIAHGKFIADRANTPGSWSFWKDQSIRLLQACDEAWVLCLPGWKESIGVQAEIRKAVDLGIPVYYLSPDLCLSWERAMHAKSKKNTPV